MKSRAASRRAGDRQIAAHALGQDFHHAQAEAGAAIAAGDIGVCLRERSKQPLYLGARKTEAAIADNAMQMRASSPGRIGARFQFHRTLGGKLHGIVDEIFQCRAQPDRIADQALG